MKRTKTSTESKRLPAITVAKEKPSKEELLYLRLKALVDEYEKKSRRH